MRAPAVPADWHTWHIAHGIAASRRDLAPALGSALDAAGTLYAWAAGQPGRVAFTGRGEAYAVTLGGVPAVVRHARRGGLARMISEDRFFARRPRFEREIALSRRLAAAGIATPEVLAGVVYRSGMAHTADVATARVSGSDLATLLYGPDALRGLSRADALAAVGRLVRRLHDAGFVHRDLQLRNVLVATGSGAASVSLLDVDTCVPINPANRTARWHNIRRFLRSWAKFDTAHGTPATPADRAVFLEACAPGHGR